jgi:CrcB protein
VTAVAVALGGAVGALLRYVLARWSATARFPWGTLAANVAGSMLLGVVAVSVDGWVRVLLATGLAGALTTYSSFALETVLLDRTDRRGAALLNVVVTLVAGAAAFALGWLLGSLG